MTSSTPSGAESDATGSDLSQHRAGGRLQFLHEESGAAIRFDQIESRRGGLYAWTELHKKGGGRPVYYGYYNLMGSRTVPELIKGAAEVKGPPWKEIIADAVLTVIRGQQEGDPPVRLSEVSTSSTIRWLLEPLIEEGGPTLLAAAGGSAKSYLSLATGAAVAIGQPLVGDLVPSTKGPVLYLDWEADKEEHAHRLNRICAGARIDPKQVDVHYRRESQALIRSVHQIARICDDLGIVFLIVDSVMLARGGDAYGPEETINLFAAVREIGRPSLLADHKSREAINKGKRGVYGSIVGENSARRVWEIRGGFDEPGRKTIRLENTKANNSPRHDPLALAFEWIDEPHPAVRIEQVPATGVLPARGSDTTPLWQSIADTLEESDPLGVGEICEALTRQGINASSDTVRKTLNRYPDRFTNVGSSTAGRWTGTDTRPMFDTADSAGDDIDIF